MIQCRSCARFLREAVLSVGILATRVKDFYGDPATQAVIFGFVNDARILNRMDGLARRLLALVLPEA
jgi:hypothetical protein